MPSSTAKRVLLYRFDRHPLEGIVDNLAYLREGGVEWITASGSLQFTPYADVKAMCFVTEAGMPDLFQDSTIFERRPKLAGLWTRFYFRDGDRLDGVLPHNLLDWPATGFLFTPPRSGASRGRVFVPRGALMATELRGVVGRTTPALRKDGTAIGKDGPQLRMFDR